MRKQRKSQTRNFSKKSLISTICFILILVIIALLYWRYPDKFDFILNLGNNSSAENSTSIKVIEAKLEGDLRVHMVDIGQGDSIIIEFPNGQNMLIDAGKVDGDKNVEKNNALTTYIDNLNITKFDYLIATHQDEDHIGEMETIFYNYEISHVYRPYVLYENSSKGDYESYLGSDFNKGKKSGGLVSKTDAYYYFLKYVKDENCSWEFFNLNSDFELVLDDNGVEKICKFDFLTPTSAVEDIGYNNANNYSPIIMLEYSGIKFLFTGDAESETEAEFLDYYKSSISQFDVDVLKVGHHGAETSTTQDFLDAINPEFALISCGVGNSYKHPRQKTLDRLFDAQISIYRTDLQGDIVATVNKSGELSFDCSKQVNSDSLWISPESSAA